jgi:hypothetical protein
MRVHRTLLALSLIAAGPACAATQDQHSDDQPLRETAPAQVDDPLASFARLVGGEWRVTFASGESAFHAWQWGPGKLSLRRLAYGMADGSFAQSPWAGEVLYWDPRLAQVRQLSVHGDIPGVGRGVAAGTIRFDGDTSTASIDLDQPRGRRKLGQIQVFEGPDRYRESLLEDTGAGLAPLNELTFVRVPERAVARSTDAEPATLELPERWGAFEALVGGGTWEATGETVGGSAFALRTTFEWEPSLEIVSARVHALHGESESTHVLDAYVFRDVRTDAMRCLALSDRGGVYEGRASFVDGGALELELELHGGDRVVPHVARFELEDDGRLRTRLWAVAGAERTLALDVLHRKLEP